MYTYIYICNVYSIHLKDMHVEATHAGCRWFSLLICTTSLLYTCSTMFNAGLPCMASARALDRTQPVASVTHWLPCEVHPYAQVLAMFAFDSYSQSKRSPRPLSRHRPCKTPYPIGNASFNKPWPNYHGSIMFYSFLIESHRNAGFQRAFFRGHCWRPQTKTRSRPFS